MKCTWVVTGMPPIELSFSSFDTEHDADTVEVYKGNGMNGRLLRKYSGSDLPPPLQSSAGTLTVAFSTDYFSTNAKGFVAVLQAAPGAPCAVPPPATSAPAARVS
jgi:hypothetical protein